MQDHTEKQQGQSGGEREEREEHGPEHLWGFSWERRREAGGCSEQVRT